ncbi:MAG: hypothetical protein DMG60_06545 [Acidobacteria bacterium]|nr:MAG: hypothetical protein DMG60_06545 [Acidobacteriota bacterium]
MASIALPFANKFDQLFPDFKCASHLRFSSYDSQNNPNRVMEMLREERWIPSGWIRLESGDSLQLTVTGGACLEQVKSEDGRPRN